MDQFGEDSSLIQLQQLYLDPLFEKSNDSEELKCIATTESLESLFTNLKKHSFKEVMDIIIGIEQRAHESVSTLTIIHDCNIIKQLVMLYFRQGSIESKDMDAQGSLLRKIADLIVYVGNFCCNQVDAKWFLFPFNRSCRFVIKNASFLNIYFDSIRKLVEAPIHPSEAIYFNQIGDAISVPPLPSFPSSKYVIELTFEITSLCTVSAGSGRCVLLRIQSSNYSPAEGGLLELIAIGTTLKLHIVSKGKEDSVDVMNGVIENCWEHITLQQTKSTKKGYMSLSINKQERYAQKMIMIDSSLLVGGHVTLCSEGFIGFVSDFALYDCSSTDYCMNSNAIISYSCKSMDQTLLFDQSPNNLNASISNPIAIRCDYINNAILSNGGVNIFFPLIIPANHLSEDMQLAHVIPLQCISHVIRIITDILISSESNRHYFDRSNGISIMTSLLELFDKECITHDLFIAINDFCQFTHQLKGTEQYDVIEKVLLNWPIWRKGNNQVKQFAIDSIVKLFDEDDLLMKQYAFDFYKQLLYDEECDDSVVTTLVFRGLTTLCEKETSNQSLIDLFTEAQQNQTSVCFTKRFYLFLTVLCSKKDILSRILKDANLGKQGILRLFIKTIIHFNEPSLRVEMYHFYADLLRSIEQWNLHFELLQDDIDLLITAYKQLCSYSILHEEYYAILSIITGCLQPTSSTTVLEVKNALCLQFLIRLLITSSSIYTRDLLVNFIKTICTNEKKKENMKKLKYDDVFLHLLYLIPKIEHTMDVPAKKPKLLPSIRANTNIILYAEDKPTEKVEKALEVLHTADSEEGFTAMTFIYKKQEAKEWCRERVINMLYEDSRGRYDSVINTIRLLLLEGIMTIYVRFAMSSMPILVQCIETVPLPYSVNQMIALLYKLALAELFELRDLSKIKKENLISFITVFISNFWTIDITQHNQQQFAGILELMARFFSDTTSHQIKTEGSKEEKEKEKEKEKEDILDAYVTLLTKTDLKDNQVIPPTCCFLYGLWLGCRIIEYIMKGKGDIMIVCEHIKAILFSNQPYLQQKEYSTILIYYICKVYNMKKEFKSDQFNDLLIAMYSLLGKSGEMSDIEAFISDKTNKKNNQIVDQVLLTFGELSARFTKQKNTEFIENQKEKNDQLDQQFARYEGSKESRALFRQASEHSSVIVMRQRLEKQRETRQNLLFLVDEIARLRSNANCMWYREKNRVQFHELSDMMNSEGSRFVMVPFYTGTSRQEARKRGGNKNKSNEVDMKSMKQLYKQLRKAQDASALSEDQTKTLKTQVEMLLKQYSNVANNVAEKKKQKESRLKGLFSRSRRGSETVVYPFTVHGLKFESMDPILMDLSFASYTELQDFMIEATIDKTEMLDVDETVENTIQYQTTIVMICFSYEIQGELTIQQDHLVFKAESIKPIGGDVPSKPLPHFNQIQDLLLKPYEELTSHIISILPRNHLLENKALEIFFMNGSSWYIDFTSAEERKEFFELVAAHVLPSIQKSIVFKRLATPSQLFRNLPITNQWLHYQISSFEYLMQLNLISGRSYQNLSQYPVFPWILSDYTSSTLDLKDPSVYRDLSRPVGALNEDRLQNYLERYESMVEMKDMEGSLPPFMYGTHYSTPGYVLHYLVRVEPYALFHIDLQNGCFDEYNRIFNSVNAAWQSSLNSQGDVKELTPEWFCFPSFLRNSSSFPLNDTDIKANCDVLLPPWAHNSPEQFIAIQREALESDYVSEHLHEWIDLIWGVNQNGENAVKHNNLFFNMTYVDSIHISDIKDDMLKKNLITQISQYGQIPTQLLVKPHPQRQLKKVVLEELNPSIQSIYLNLPSTIYPQLVLPTRHKSSIHSILIANKVFYILDSSGRCSVHEYTNHVNDKNQFPITIAISDKHTKRVVSGLTTETKFVLSHTINDDMPIVISYGDRDNKAIFHWISKSSDSIKKGDERPIDQHYNSIQCCSSACSLPTCYEVDSFMNKINMIAFGGKDQLVTVWKLQNQAKSSSYFHLLHSNTIKQDITLYNVFTGFAGSIHCVFIEPSTNLLYVADSTCCIYIYSLINQECLTSFHIQEELVPLLHGSCKSTRIMNLVCSKRGDGIALLRYKKDHKVGYALCHFSSNGIILHTSLIEEESILSQLYICNDCSHLLYCYKKGFIIRSLLDSMKIVNTIECTPPSPYSCFAVAQNEHFILSGLEDGTIIAFGTHYGFVYYV